jgi:hypothetical protein
MRDLIRRNERLTGMAVRPAGRFEALRDRRLSVRDRWGMRTSDEARYWLDALRTDGATERFADRLAPYRS